MSHFYISADFQTDTTDLLNGLLNCKCHYIFFAEADGGWAQQASFQPFMEMNQHQTDNNPQMKFQHWKGLSTLSFAFGPSYLKKRD